MAPAIPHEQLHLKRIEAKLTRISADIADANQLATDIQRLSERQEHLITESQRAVEELYIMLRDGFTE